MRAWSSLDIFINLGATLLESAFSSESPISKQSTQTNVITPRRKIKYRINEFPSFKKKQHPFLFY